MDHFLVDGATGYFRKLLIPKALLLFLYILQNYY